MITQNTRIQTIQTLTSNGSESIPESPVNDTCTRHYEFVRNNLKRKWHDDDKGSPTRRRRNKSDVPMFGCVIEIHKLPFNCTKQQIVMTRYCHSRRTICFDSSTRITPTFRLTSFQNPRYPNVGIRGIEPYGPDGVTLDFFERRPKLEVARVRYGLDGIVLTKLRCGKESGNAFVLFESEEERKKALEKDGQYIGRRCIKLAPSTSEQFEIAVSLASYQPQRSTASTSTDRSIDISQRSEPRNVVMLRGLPFKAQINDILSFLNNFRERIVLHGIHMALNEERQPNGYAFVEMVSEEAASDVVEQTNLKYMSVDGKQRYIEVIQCTSDQIKDLFHKAQEECERVKSKFAAGVELAESESECDDASISAGEKSISATDDENSEYGSESSESSDESIVFLGAVIKKEKSVDDVTSVEKVDDDKEKNANSILNELSKHHLVYKPPGSAIETNMDLDLLIESAVSFAAHHTQRSTATTSTDRSIDISQRSEPRNVIMLRGLPFKAQIHDILSFLNNFRERIVLHGIHMALNEEHETNGYAFVEMISEEAALDVVEQTNLKYMSVDGKQRYIEVTQWSINQIKNLFHKDQEECDRVKSKFAAEVELPESESECDDASISAGEKSASATDNENSEYGSESSESSDESNVFLGAVVKKQKSVYDVTSVEKVDDDKDKNANSILNELLKHKVAHKSPGPAIETNIDLDLLIELEQCLPGAITNDRLQSTDKTASTTLPEDSALKQLVGSTVTTVDVNIKDAKPERHELVIVGFPMWETDRGFPMPNSTTQLMKYICFDMGIDPDMLVLAKRGGNVISGQCFSPIIILSFLDDLSKMNFCQRYAYHKEFNPFLTDSYCRRNYNFEERALFKKTGKHQ